MTFPSTIHAYENTKKTGWTATGSKDFALADPPTSFYLEGCSYHSDVLDAEVKAEMTLNSGVKCRNEVRYTVVKTDIHGTDKDGVTVLNQDEKYPGVFIHFNLDNDNDSDNSEPASCPRQRGADYAEITSAVVGEDDVKSLTMSLLPSLDFGSAVLSVPMGFKLWKDDEKGASNLVLDCSESAGNKRWDLSDSGEKAEFLGLCSSLYVEGTDNNLGDIRLSYKTPTGAEVSRDCISYESAGADCGAQPKTDAETIYWLNKGVSPPAWTPTAGWVQRDRIEGASYGLSLERCAYSIVDDLQPNEHSGTNRATLTNYNCIGHAVDRNFEWYNAWDIDKYYGDNDGVFEDSDMDEFFDILKGWSRLFIPGADDAEHARSAEAMYYSYGVTWNYGDPPGSNPAPGPGYHGARKSSCSCADSGWNWSMYTSKLGQWEQIEHVWDQANGAVYGEYHIFYGP